MYSALDFLQPFVITQAKTVNSWPSGTVATVFKALVQSQTTTAEAQLISISQA
jgi:hypothetical protein